jgi:hypothetical protein
MKALFLTIVRQKNLNAKQSYAKATDSKRRKAFILRELTTIRITFYTPHYQPNREF